MFFLLSPWSWRDGKDLFLIIGKVFNFNCIIFKIGCLLTGIFAQNSVATMSGDAAIKGGWVDGNVIKTKLNKKLNNNSVRLINNCK